MKRLARGFIANMAKFFFWATPLCIFFAFLPFPVLWKAYLAAGLSYVLFSRFFALVHPARSRAFIIIRDTVKALIFVVMGYLVPLLWGLDFRVFFWAIIVSLVWFSGCVLKKRGILGSLYSAYWIVIWVAVIECLTVFKGPDAGDYARIARESGIRPVFLLNAYPDGVNKKLSVYGLAVDEAVNTLFISVKGRGGSIVRMNIDGPNRQEVFPIDCSYLRSQGLPDRKTAFLDLRASAPYNLPLLGFVTRTFENYIFPENIFVDPDRQRVYALVYDIYSILSLSYKSGNMRMEDIFPLHCEPTGLCRDPDSDSLVVYDSPDFFRFPLTAGEEPVSHPEIIHMPLPLGESIVFSSAAKRLYYSSYSSAHLFELDTQSYRITRKLFVGFPLAGMDVDEKRGILYVTSPLLGRLLKVDVKEFKETDAIPVGNAVRVVRYDAKRDLLYVGNYAYGTFSIISGSSPHKMIHQLFLGRLLRAIVITPSGRVFVGSECGVFEVKLEEIISREKGD